MFDNFFTLPPFLVGLIAVFDVQYEYHLPIVPWLVDYAPISDAELERSRVFCGERQWNDLFKMINEPVELLFDTSRDGRIEMIYITLRTVGNLESPFHLFRFRYARRS